jgi:hypothetical protein
MLGGPKGRIESPNTRFSNKNHKSCERETKNLRKLVLASKVVNPFTRALAPPFIERRRDFLHPENTLKFREYSKCEHVHERLIHPVICGADSYIYKPATISHVKPRLFEIASLTWLLPDSQTLIHDS